VLEDPNKKVSYIKDDKRTDLTFRGKTIVLAKQQGKPFGGRWGCLKARAMQKGDYPEEKRIEAVTLYVATGSLTAVSKLSHIPVHILRNWRNTQWFQELLAEVRHENNEKVDAKFSEIIDNSLDQLSDRVINGDFFVKRDGELGRKPISARDLSIVAAINVDKRQLLRGEPTSRSENVGKLEDKSIGKLEKLAETFENLARFGRQPKVIEVEAVEPTEALPAPVEEVNVTP
jgi:transposase-like protein